MTQPGEAGSTPAAPVSTNPTESVPRLKLPVLNLLAPWQRRLALGTAAAFLFYTVFGFFLLPPIVRVVTVRQLAEALDRPVSIAGVGLNPYTFAVTIHGLLVKDKDGTPLVSWNSAYVNFQLASLLGHSWVFKEVKLSEPWVRARMNKDYTLNFSDIVARLSPTIPRESSDSSPRPSWRIKRLRLTGAKASFTDLTPRMPFERTIGPLELTLLDFRTDSSNKNFYAFSGITDGGEHFSWRGFFYVDPLRSEGVFSLRGVSLVKYAPLYQDLVRFEIQDGIIDLASSYRYERSAATHLLALTNTTFALKALKVAEKATGQTVAEASSLMVSGGSVDAVARRAEAESVAIAGGRFCLRRNKDTSVNAIELAKPAEASPGTPGGILLLLRAMTNVVAMLLNSTNLSTGAIGALSLTNCALHLEDLVNAQPVRLDLDGIAVQARNLSNRAGTNMTAELSLRWDTNGTVRAGIKAGLFPPRAEVTLALENLNLRPLAPYLEPRLDILVLGGKLGLAGTVRLRNDPGQLAEAGFEGEVRLDEFSTAKGAASEELLRWNSLRLSGIEAGLNPPVVSVAKAALEDVVARLIIETNRTINLPSAMRQGGTNTAAAPPSTNAAVGLRPKVSLASLVVSNASVHFIDRSLQPHVNINLDQLSGTLSGLSSDNAERAELHLLGAVDKTARAEITGKIGPWNSKQPLDLKISLQNMDLLPEDSYSGKYLGYRLNKGKLSAVLSYQVAERKLKSENHITLDQFTLGAGVESPDATRLPVRLAIALLKDRDGKIVLELPINGSLDDPQFNLGTVVYHAFEAVVTRIVTSPFSALGALFGGKGEELSFQDFEPGMANLLPAAMAKLDLLATALEERPELRLEIEGSTDGRTDLEALRHGKLNQRSPGQSWSPLLSTGGSGACRVEAAPAAIPRKTFSFEKGAFALSSRVMSSSFFETKSRTQESPFPHGATKAFTDEKGAAALMLVLGPPEAATSWNGDAQLLEDVQLASGALRALAAERAEHVRAYLIQSGKVAAARVTESARGPGSKGSRVYVRLL